MRTDDLIAQLAGAASPVRPLRSPGVRSVVWLAVAVVCAGAACLAFGVRSDLDEVVRQSAFVWVAFVALATMASAAPASLVLAVPAAERSPVLRTMTIALLSVWALSLGWAVARAGHGLAGVSDWPVCFLRVLLIGLIPGVLLVSMLRRAAPLRRAWTSALAAIAALAAGAFAIQLICPLDDAGHALLGHYGPVAALGAAAAFAARRLFR